jgi:hypothetical protein
MSEYGGGNCLKGSERRKTETAELSTLRRAPGYALRTGHNLTGQNALERYYFRKAMQYKKN